MAARTKEKVSVSNGYTIQKVTEHVPKAARAGGTLRVVTYQVIAPTRRIVAKSLTTMKAAEAAANAQPTPKT